MSRTRKRQSQAQTTPQQRSDLARKASQARRSQSMSPCEERSAGYTDVLSRTQPQAISPPSLPSSPDSSSSVLATKNPKSKIQHPKSRHSSWLDERFCLHLYQNSASEWRLLTPSGLDLPATNSEISLWLDLQVLNQRLE